MAIDRSHGTVRCTRCGDEHVLRFRNLYLVTGAPATGKSTLVRGLAPQMKRTPVFDTDLFGPCSHPDWVAWASTWLLMAYGLAQSGHPVVLCGYGINRSDATRLPPHRLLGAIHVLNLDIDDDELRARLGRRFDYDAPRIERKVARAAALRADADVNVDVTGLEPDAISAAVRRWLIELGAS